MLRFVLLHFFKATGCVRWSKHFQVIRSVQFVHPFNATVGFNTVWNQNTYCFQCRHGFSVVILKIDQKDCNCPKYLRLYSKLRWLYFTKSKDPLYLGIFMKISPTVSNDMFSKKIIFFEQPKPRTFFSSSNIEPKHQLFICTFWTFAQTPQSKKAQRAISHSYFTPSYFLPFSSKKV